MPSREGNHSPFTGDKQAREVGSFFRVWSPVRRGIARYFPGNPRHGQNITDFAMPVGTAEACSTLASAARLVTIRSSVSSSKKLMTNLNICR
jgi:hypothetical protein